MSPTVLVLFQCVATIIGLVYASRRASVAWEHIILLVAAGMMLGCVFFSGSARLTPYFPLGIFLGYCAMAGTALRKELSPKTDETTLLVLTINFLYLLTTFESRTRWIALALGAAPVLVTLYSAFTMNSLSERVRLILSFWYIAVSMTFAVRFALWFLTGIRGNESHEQITSIFDYGLFAASTVGTGAAFFGFLNFQREGKENLKRWKLRILRKELPLFAEQISPEELPPGVALVIAGFQILLFALNWLFTLVPPPMALSMAVSIFPAVVSTFIQTRASKDQSINARVSP